MRPMGIKEEKRISQELLKYIPNNRKNGQFWKTMRPRFVVKFIKGRRYNN